MKTTMTKSVIALALLAVIGTAHAQQNATEQKAQERAIIEQARTGIEASREAKAQAWGVTNEELARYEKLTSTGGIYSSLGKDLTALEVLGMEARSESERQRYAELMVDQETQYQKNVLAFESAKMDVLKKRYPHMDIWYSKEEVRQKSLPDLLKGLSAHQDKRLVIYASADECDSKCQDYIAKVRSSASSSTRVDIFFTNTRNSDSKLREAVSAIGLKPSDIDGSNLTVNHDKGYFSRLQIDGVKTLPMAVKLDKTGQITPVKDW